MHVRARIYLPRDEHDRRAMHLLRCRRVRTHQFERSLRYTAPGVFAMLPQTRTAFLSTMLTFPRRGQYGNCASFASRFARARMIASGGEKEVIRRHRV